MLGFLFLIIIIAALYTSYYFTNKIAAQRKQILLLKYQNIDLSETSRASKTANVSIEYVFPVNTKGFIKKNCELLICPIDNSSIVNFINENTLVGIEDSAYINNQLWYEISLISESRVNSKGWVKEDYLELQEDFND